MYAVEAQQISKRYSLAPSPARRLFDLVASPDRKHTNDFWALRDVSFAVPQGESFGVVGANGSGKSTLLQIIAGVMQPTLGAVRVSGRISAILELGAGFNPDFSGRENVRLNAAILGLTDAEINDRFSLIEDFAEIGQFIDQPVRTYSSGMVMRLAFSIAVHIDPQVLIVDEALSVGDIYFQQRCLRHLHRLRDRGATLLFVSHAASELRALCDRCLWLDHGVVRELGETDAVVSRYLAHSISKSTAPALAPAMESGSTVASAPVAAPAAGNALVAPIAASSHRFGTGLAEVLGADIVDPHDRPLHEVSAGETIVVRVHVRAHQAVSNPIVGFLMRNERGETIYGTNSSREGSPIAPMNPGVELVSRFEWIAPAFLPGRYFFTVAIVDGALTEFESCDYIDDALPLNFLPAKSSSSADTPPVPAPEGYLQFDYQVRTYQVQRELLEA